MVLTKFKNSIGKNLFAFAGWLGMVLLLLWYLRYKPDYLHAYSLILRVIITYGLISLSIIAYTIELILDYKIKNKFLLENKFYNIFWIIGTLFSSLFILILIITIIINCYISYFVLHN